MTQEEKARAYDEAITTAKQILSNNCSVVEKLCIECVFPELKESEDERIRKSLIDMLKNDEKCYLKEIAWLEKQGEFYTKRDVDNAYIEGMAFAKDELEKQGEQKSVDKEYTFKAIPRLLDMMEPTEKANAYCQKLIDALAKEGYNTDAKIVEEVLKGWNGEDIPMAVMDEQPITDKVEPKFRVGDWIINPKSGNILQIKNVLLCGNKGNYEFGNNSMPIKSVDKYYKLWTIQDAKDGDILIDKSNIEYPFIFKETKPSDIKTDVLNPLTILGYCGIGGAGFTKGSGWGDTANCTYYPATKEQCNLLFQKMHEAGYEWDAEKKELRKIEQEPTDNDIKEALRTEYEKGRADAIAEIQNPAWSKEDESYLNTTIAYLKDAKEFKKTADNCINWLKSLRSQPKKEWSEEDEEFLRRAINATKDAYPITAKWLKSLKDIVQPSIKL